MIENATFKPIPELILGRKPTRFLAKGTPFQIMGVLFDVIAVHLDQEKDKPEVAKNQWKLTFTGTFQETEYINKEETKQEATVIVEKDKLLEQKAIMKVELHEIEKDSKYLVNATRVDGSAFAFFQTFERLHEEYKKVFKEKEQAEQAKQAEQAQE